MNYVCTQTRAYTKTRESHLISFLIPLFHFFPDSEREGERKKRAKERDTLPAEE